MRVPIALLAVLLLAGFACARTSARSRLEPAGSAKMDARLRRLATSGADTTVGVFIQATHPVGERERELLERAGVSVGTVTGDLLTGRVSARRLGRVADLPLVRRMELSRTVRPQGRATPGALLTPVPDGAA